MRLSRAVLLAAVPLAACVTLLPKERAVPLYTFVGAPGPVPAPASRPGFTVRAAIGAFEPAAAGDQLLTVTGARSADIAGARWVSPARSLFEAALAEQFADHDGQARLLDRGEAGAPDLILDLAVTRFETRYDGGAPTAEVRIEAALSTVRGPVGRRSRVFEVATPAAADTVTAIVAAYGQSVATVISQLIAWTDARGAP